MHVVARRAEFGMSRYSIKYRAESRDIPGTQYGDEVPTGAATMPNMQRETMNVEFQAPLPGKPFRRDPRCRIDVKMVMQATQPIFTQH